MDIKINKLSTSEVEINFVLEPKGLEPYLNQALKSLGQNIKIDGFRPGKIPEDIAKKHIDDMKLYEEAAGLAIKEIYPKTIIEKNIEAIGRPEITITKLAPNNPLEFKAKIGVMPEIKLPANYKKIAQDILKNKTKISVSDTELEEILNWLRNSQAKLEKVDRPAQSGDAVEIDFETKSNGVSIEGANGKNHLFVLSTSHFIPGFEEQIIGLKTGDSKEFQIQAPDDWPYSHLKGKLLDFKVVVKQVNNRVLPQIDDKFAQSVGKFDDLGDMKEKLKSEILIGKENKEMEKIRLEILEATVDKTEIILPESIIEAEKDKILEELQYSLSESGLKLEDYLSRIKVNEEQLRNDLKVQAEKRIKSAIILKEIAKQEKVEITEEELMQKIRQEKAKYQDSDINQAQFDTENFKEYIKGVLRNERVFEILEQ